MLNVIIQAGGRGSRMRNLTWNKPKCLLPYNGKPILYHVFDKFPNANFFIISDYKKEILEKYLQINNPQVNYKIVESFGKETCAGIKSCLEYIQQDEEIIICWSDIIFENFFPIPKIKLPTIYRTNKFASRYEITDDKKLIKRKTNVNGVAGIFYIPNKNLLSNVDDDGSFMKWFLKNMPEYNVLDNQEIIESGEYDEYKILTNKKINHRFFNNIKIYDDCVLKQCINSEYEYLIDNEINWYNKISEYKIKNIPKIINYSPYILEKIKGYHLFDVDKDEVIKQQLIKIINVLREIHDKDILIAIEDQTNLVYVKKTLDRVQKIQKILPFNNKEFITINGLKCANVFFNKDKTQEIFKKISKQLSVKYFKPIHGDPSLSNIIIKEEQPILIDPRGYFDKKGIWGDPRYDFAKLYFSCIGKYDLFNKKNFILYLDNDTVEIFFQETKLEYISKEIFENIFEKEELNKIKLIHALIWFSMSAYSIEDVDSIIASHYLGLFYLEKCFGETNE